MNQRSLNLLLGLALSGALTSCVVRDDRGADDTGDAPAIEICDNEADDDLDGLIDCDDVDCAEACIETNEIVCSDGLDGDSDGLVDCYDPDCDDNNACMPVVETDCADGVDEDGDGGTDCDDVDCIPNPACWPDTETTCDDRFDEDWDGRTDCEDPDCRVTFACRLDTEGSCTDFWDADWDGLTDCDDSDCRFDDACVPATELDCEDDIDLDRDGATDCDDSDCLIYRYCTDEDVCDDNLDNEGDGYQDCLDEDCVANAPVCDVTLADASLGSRTGSSIASGTTAGMGNDWTLTCAGGGNVDYTYAWVAPSAGTFTFDTGGCSYDSALALFNPARTSLTCNDDAIGRCSRVSWTFRKGEMVFIVVDGWSGSSAGPYVLNITPG